MISILGYNIVFGTVKTIGSEIRTGPLHSNRAGLNNQGAPIFEITAFPRIYGTALVAFVAQITLSFPKIQNILFMWILLVLNDSKHTEIAYINLPYKCHF